MAGSVAFEPECTREGGSHLAPVDLCILDLASLRYQRNRARTSVTVYSALREVLAVVDTPADMDDREVAFLAADAALSTARLVRIDPERGRVRARLGLYNPYTAEVSVGAVPETKVFSDEELLELPEAGLLGRLEGKGSQVRLEVPGRTLIPVEHTFTSLTRVYSSHRA